MAVEHRHVYLAAPLGKALWSTQAGGGAGAHQARQGHEHGKVGWQVVLLQCLPFCNISCYDVFSPIQMRWVCLYSCYLEWNLGLSISHT